MVIPQEFGCVLTVSENGFGKRTDVTEFPAKGRGGQGVIAMQTSERNGALVGAVQVFDGEEIMLISDQGTMVRTRVDEVSVLSRNTQGVRLIKVKGSELLIGLERIEETVNSGASGDDSGIADADEGAVDDDAKNSAETGTDSDVAE